MSDEKTVVRDDVDVFFEEGQQITVGNGPSKRIYTVRELSWDAAMATLQGLARVVKKVSEKLRVNMTFKLQNDPIAVFVMGMEVLPDEMIVIAAYGTGVQPEDSDEMKVRCAELKKIPWSKVAEILEATYNRNPKVREYLAKLGVVFKVAPAAPVTEPAGSANDQPVPSPPSSTPSSEADTAFPKSEG